VSTSSFSAPSATASDAAAESGVDVVHEAVRSGGDAGDHRDPAGLDQVEHRSGRTCATSPTSAEVDLLAVDDGVGATGGEQAGVLAGEPDRDGAVLVDQPDSSRWTWPTSTIRTTSIASWVVHPQPALNSECDARAGRASRDLRAPAVNHDRLEAGEAAGTRCPPRTPS
jgi:hypothetical protein